jgi:competence protein ComEA
MEQATAIPSTPETGVLPTWPRCVQITVALLLALGIGFLLGRFVSGGSSAFPVDDVTTREASPRLNLNHASRAELAVLPGLGPTRAQSIDDYRREHGPFRTVDDLRNVVGIGPKTLERVRPMLFVSEPAGRSPAADTVPPAVARPGTPTTPATKSKKEAALAESINVNTATVAELQRLPGIGAKLAQRIVDERSLRGRFKAVDDLRRVSGIGAKTLEKLRPYVAVNDALAVAGP